MAPKRPSQPQRRKSARRRVAKIPKRAVPSVPQSGFGMSDDAIQRALRSGESRGMLEDYFGPAQYAELRDLARDAATRSVRGGPRVLILPGIMGSTLGRQAHLFQNILWLDPVEIGLGRLTELKLKGPSNYHA